MAEKAEPAEQPKATAATETVELRHEADAADGTLSIGGTDYDVTGGVVRVALEHVDAARQAGFR